MNAPFRTKPWYLAIFTAGRWVTLYPWIYLPANAFPTDRPDVAAHEAVHLAQQKAMGLWSWLFRYFVSRSFRLDQEAEGIAMECSCTDAPRANLIVLSYSDQLAGSAYFWAAKSPTEAEAVIRLKLIQPGLGPFSGG